MENKPKVKIELTNEKSILSSESLHNTQPIVLKDKSKAELTSDKSFVESEVNQNKVLIKENKKVSKIKNIIYIIIIALCTIGIILFLKHQDKKTAIESIKIEDRTGDYCRESFYFFYEDEKYKYYFICEKKYYVIYDEKDYKLNEALEKGIINITTLDDKNIIYYKETK